MNKIKVAFISFSLVGGGAERNIINLSHYLKSNNIDADILLFKSIDDYIYEYRTYPDFLKVYSGLNETKHIPLILKPIKTVILIINLAKRIYQNKYKVLIAAQEYSPFYMTVFLAYIFKIKSILLVGNNIRLEEKEKNIFERIMNYVYFYCSLHLCSKIVCMSYGLKRNISDYFNINPDKIEMIYSGVNVEYIRKKTHKIKKVENKNLLFIILGRLVPKKGHLELLELFKSMTCINPHIKLLIVGKGPSEMNIRMKIRELRIQKKIKLLGFTKNPYKQLKLADAFFFTSKYEGFGNVIIEAMSCSKPIISTNCKYGPSEIMRKKYICGKGVIECKEGLLIPQLDIHSQKSLHEISTVILKKLTIKKKMESFSRESSKRALNFDINIMGDKYKKMIINILK